MKIGKIIVISTLICIVLASVIVESNIITVDDNGYWKKIGSTIMFNHSSDNLSLGSDDETGYKLDVNGSTHLSGNSLFERQYWGDNISLMQPTHIKHNLGVYPLYFNVFTYFNSTATAFNSFEHYNDINLYNSSVQILNDPSFPSISFWSWDATRANSFYTGYTLLNNILYLRSEDNLLAKLWINGLLEVDNYTHFNDSVVIEKNLTVNGIQASSPNALNLKSDVIFNENVTFERNITVYDNLYLSQNSKLYYNNIQVSFVPLNSIMMYSGNDFNSFGYCLNTPGWHLCNGLNGTSDLRGRFIIGSNSTISRNSTGGQSSNILQVGNLPRHDHNMTGYTYNGAGGNLGLVLRNSWSSSTLYTYQTGTRGSAFSGDMKSTSFTNLPPYYALAYIQFVGY